tara:strand:- start:3095 stop:3940 length:846 start_codon:yes stop_codon:yes gene_type:complete
MAENELGALSSISNLSAEDIKGKGVDYYRDLGKLISPAYERPTGAEIAFNFFSGMSEVASQPGSTFGGSLGGGARKAGDYLFKDNLAAKKRERELGLTGLKLANVMGKGKSTKSMTVVGDFTDKTGKTVPLGSAYNPTNKDLTAFPASFAPAANADAAVFSWFLNGTDPLTPQQSEAVSLALSRLTAPQYKTVKGPDGVDETVVERALSKEALEKLYKTSKRFSTEFPNEEDKAPPPVESKTKPMSEADLSKVGEKRTYEGIEYIGVNVGGEFKWQAVKVK